MKAECEASSVPKTLTLHCILLQESLCGKSVDMSCVMNPVITEFKSFLEKVESLSPDLPYYIAVTWLSCGKILSCFFSLRTEIEMFLNEKERSMEIVSAVTNGTIKDKFKEGSLVQFYNFLPKENYPKIKDFAHSFLSIFRNTYRCEQIFSLLKFTKSKYKGNLIDQHLRDILIIQQTELEPQFDTILASKSKLHISH
ncbi:hypothetical protein PR048_012293 [Dryococelus australis]|uniref:Uncharacterized protein n=1 Tax=Dryococelus australis TaxID=614101 RepID=A0ABQ9HPQ1_9NEOP|nr:hypothetical protein PR048_012293 [Dryococelus australis]